jgi:glyoxylase-like metal-dependent hydrolase (beta-lactamase superfamily II)
MLEIKTFEVGSFGTNMYLVSGESGLLLIDPACSSLYEQQMLLRALPVFPPLRGDRGGLGLTILATHGHLDHLWGAAWACEQWHTPVLMHEADIPMAKAMQAQYDLFGIGGTPVPFPLEPLPVNQSVSPSIHHSAAEPRLIPSLTILSTPGHTPGSVCFYFPEDGVLFSGDTLFQMGYGRTDLPGGDIQQLWHSLDLLLALPPETVVYPGHGAPTTIAAERRRW